MKDQLIQLADMLAILYPEYEPHLRTLQDECRYFAHQVEGDSLTDAIINICQSPRMVEDCPEKCRIEIENLLLGHSQPDVIH